jgi:general L-amino acid transport system permease protein
MTVEMPPIVESSPPPVVKMTPVEWMRARLFNTWYNGLLTIVFGSGVVYAFVGLVRALFGFDYTILRTNLTLFMVGLFPRDQLWRSWVSGILLALMIGLAAGLAHGTARDRAAQAGMPFRATTLRDILRRFWPLLVLILVILSLTRTPTPAVMTVVTMAAGYGAYLVGRRLSESARRLAWFLVPVLGLGGYLALAAFDGVGWSGWGGLHLNVFLTMAGILFAFPLGLLLALGRRSTFPIIRTISVTYIELVRGVPLIAILIFGYTAIGFLLPEGLRPSIVTRMLIAITLFEAAYVAEVVRGGLQAVPRGQREAAQALGLPAWKSMRLIVLPQALRATIPAMVGQFISLWKDTTLVAILGVLDVLRVAFNVNTQPDFLGRGLFALTLPFAALVFWVGSYTMSREARRLEKKLGVGER